MERWARPRAWPLDHQAGVLPSVLDFKQLASEALEAACD
jgi:hypothetical protein